ncbi:MAG TPA: hypothetical protein DF715_08890 [Oceanicaulis sp.]|uniref:YdhG-like domain-containing protein n=1 Tax=Glycocaulis albus TaxID=1382801 RepID=A0ABQ1XWJ5_9PROT|nr:DUF1801 domain-containing protein [Glycocaulis albus]MBV5259320.1 DUF1801 domain-containing protein [Synechococcus moorigangaii CMS01]GGH05536.1 hypothetical protein GCM10007420_22560 [Glycocaulis albus]HCY55622.1 hypothetical protein [Oceanicaulis sp.]
MSADAYFERLDREKAIAPLARQLREWVRARAPHLSEIMKWGYPWYQGGALVCAIVPHKAHINLQFSRGAELAAHVRVEGSGKAMRHVKIYGADDLDDGLAAILADALALDRT